MIRTVSMDEISDGKLYGLNDMVKAGCEDCKGCSACCHGMGTSIVLDPYDLYRLMLGTSMTAQQLLGTHLELNVVDGIIQPNLKMAGDEECCTFLDGAGRCSIHAYRPGICRLFPLGRYYEDGSFRYFLQVHECRKENRTKVKVRKWIDTPDAARYETFIRDWHYFLKDLQAKTTPQNAKEISMDVLTRFYFTPYQPDQDFYEQFQARLRETAQARNK
ncbi:MAG: YkgJ family cysteine cluster protein [Lachnospiraceae bacterium]|nr:YkgJ family cysteine cluster protein [Lachnospiraceae bacterium]